MSLFLIGGISNSLLAWDPPAYGQNGMVVAHDELAAEAGRKVLAAGGNAIDAAVAVGYALAVTYPPAGNIGGGGFMVIRMADGRMAAIDYREKAPARANRDMFLDDSGRVVPGLSLQGGLAVGVPGTVAGLQMALDNYGTMKLKEVINPAIDLAKRGFPVNFYLSYALHYLNQAAAKYPETVRVFGRDGNPPKPGEIFKQPDLARTLKTIRRKGPAGFYQGKVAEKLVESVQAAGGIISLEDLENYQPVLRRPVTGEYKGYQVLSMPPPSSGGIALISMLNMLKQFELDTMDWHGADYVQVLTEVERRAYADRSVWFGDADYWPVPTETLLSMAYANTRMADFVWGKATPSEMVQPLGDAAMDSLKAVLRESEETTHYSVVDKWGNAVSTTTTLNWTFGSLVTVNDCGFLLNDEMDDFSAKPGVPNAFGLVGNEANAIQPNKRMLSSMTPTIFVKNDSVRYIIGTPGGSTIITSVMQVFLNAIEERMGIVDAVRMPRVHHQWLPDVIYIEPYALGPETIAALERNGYRVVIRSTIGEVNAIGWDPIFKGWIGAPDQRGAAAAVGY
ncbi:MAG: gamma-glutamyltransferase [Candidatus Marinimicrobia bacterium]|nr:gamma-glutamyltransferase [Candidatus Neomarinimicrobiota bacterium]MCF7840294.1 gamma-glutamyltransferase [Candidatus Neomarinimicrobiota bacterium]